MRDWNFKDSMQQPWKPWTRTARRIPSWPIRIGISFPNDTLQTISKVFGLQHATNRCRERRKEKSSTPKWGTDFRSLEQLNSSKEEYYLSWNLQIELYVKSVGFL